MATVQSDAAPAPFTLVQWLIAIIASIGFFFDSYELLMLPLIVRPALSELLAVAPNSPLVNEWVGYVQFVPAVAGGIFGLLGGYFTDLFGRRKVLTWSILLYAFGALAAGFSTSVSWLLFWRCLTFIGVCVEFVAAVAWLAELFPNPKQREALIGYTQAFGSLGGVAATGAYYLIVTYSHDFPQVHGGHEAWRYTLMSGVIPALPLILIRPFLPESPTWQQKKVAGTLKRPSIGELFQPQFRTTTIVTTVMMACVYAAAFGAIQQMPRIVPGLPEVIAQRQEQQTVAAAQPPAQRAETLRLAAAQEQQTVASVQSYQEFGGLAGRILLAFLAVQIVGRRSLLRLFQIPGLILLPLVFLFSATGSLMLAKWGIFAVGLATIAQFSFWGNYLPRVYPTYLRGTGESFAANVGGRMFGTSAALITTQLVASMPGGALPIRLAYASALVGTAAYIIAVVASIWLPEPPHEELPD